MQLALAFVCALALLAASTDATTRSRRATASVFSLQERLALLVDYSELETDTLNTNVNDVKTAIQNSASSVNAAAQVVVNAAGAQLDARAAAATAAVASASTSVNSVNALLSATISAMTAYVNAEVAARQAAATSLTNQAAAIDASVTAGLTAAAADRSTIRATRATDTILATVSTQLVAAVATEVSRAVVEAAAQSVAVAAVRPSFSTLIKGAMSTEASRADTACASMAVGSAFSLTVRDGSLDHTACTVEGVMYYSSALTIPMLCADGFYTPINFMSNFLGTKVLGTAQVASLMQVLGQSSSWTRCYTLSVNGASSSTWHTNCDAKGPTVILAKSSSAVWGGFNCQGWTSRGGYYVTSIRAMLFRFNGNAFEGVYATNQPYYAFYDSNSYGPTFGAGHDWYTPSSMNSGSFSSYTYAGLGYSGSFLAATTSTSITELEAWVLAV